MTDQEKYMLLLEDMVNTSGNTALIHLMGIAKVAPDTVIEALDTDIVALKVKDMYEGTDQSRIDCVLYYRQHTEVNLKKAKDIVYKLLNIGPL